MTLQEVNQRQIRFRADWLLECCSGYESISWGRLGKWAKSNRLWTDENGDELTPNPIPVHNRRRVLNTALKLLESLGHIDIIWQDRVVSRPVSWVRTCWEPDINDTMEWVLSGTRCEDMIEDLRTQTNLLEEDLLHVDFKDKQIRDIQKEQRFNLSVKLPDRISFEGGAAPNKPDGRDSLGSLEYPGSWELAQSISQAKDLHDVIMQGGKEEPIDNETLSKMDWLRPKENRFSVGPPPEELYSDKLCLIQRHYASRGWSKSYETITLVSSDRPGFTRVCKKKLNREEYAWLSYYLLHENVRTLMFDYNQNTLSHPVTLDLPTIIGRILVLCSGRPPKAEIIRGKLYISHRNVSGALALEIAESLNVELIVIEEE